MPESEIWVNGVDTYGEHNGVCLVWTSDEFVAGDEFLVVQDSSCQTVYTGYVALE